MLRRILAIIVALLGLVAMAAAITSATLWKPSGTVTTTFTARPNTTIVVTDPGVLQAPADKVKVQVTVGSGGPVVAAVGRQSDVAAWAGNNPVERLTGFATDQTFSTAIGPMSDAETTLGSAEASDSAPTLAVAQDSDLWTSAQVVNDSAILEWQRQVGRWCLLIAPAGTDAAALATANLNGLTLAVTWPRAVSTPWLWPGVVIGLVLLLVALALLVLDRRRRAGARQPLVSSESTTADADSQADPVGLAGAKAAAKPTALPRPPSRYELAQTASLAPVSQPGPAALDETAKIAPVVAAVSAGDQPKAPEPSPWRPGAPSGVLQPDEPDWADTAWPLMPAVPDSAPPATPVDTAATPPRGLDQVAPTRPASPTWPTPRRQSRDAAARSAPPYITAEQPPLRTQSATPPAPAPAATTPPVPAPAAPPPAAAPPAAAASLFSPPAAPPPVPAWRSTPTQAAEPAELTALTPDLPELSVNDTQVMALDDIVEAVRQGHLVGLTRRQIRQAEAAGASSGRAEPPDRLRATRATRPGMEGLARPNDAAPTPRGGMSTVRGGWTASDQAVPRLTSPTSRSAGPISPATAASAAPPYALRPGGPPPEPSDRTAPTVSAASVRAHGFLAAIAAGRISEAEGAPPESTNATQPAAPWVAPWLNRSASASSDTDQEAGA